MKYMLVTSYPLFNLLIEVYNIEGVIVSLYEFIIQQPFTFAPEGCSLD